MPHIMRTHSFRNPLTARCPITDGANMLNTANSEEASQKRKVMEKLHLRFHRNSLMINTEKTIAISFDTRQNRNSLKCQAKFSNMNIASKSESKFLGI
jgi:hypothetical protein